MNTSWNTILLAALGALWMTVAAHARPERTSVKQPDPGSVSRTTERQMPAIRVWVIDSVRLEEKTLAAALNKAQVIFGDAGVRVLWTRCPAQANQAELNVCQPDDTSKLFLRIVRQPAIGFGSRHALGQAFSGEAGSQYATIFHDRVLAMVASRKPGSEALVLGHVIAHELGHLLLGTSAHSSFGLMAAGWSAADLERAPAGLLEFSSAEAATIRAAVIRRNIAAGASGGSEAATSRAH